MSGVPVSCPPGCRVSVTHAHDRGGNWGPVAFRGEDPWAPIKDMPGLEELRAPEPAPSPRLSDEEVDRIARRILEVQGQQFQQAQEAENRRFLKNLRQSIEQYQDDGK